MHKIKEKIKSLSPGNLVAIPAFLLALGSLVWQAIGYFYSAEVKIFLPDIVEIGCIGYDYKSMECPKDSNVYIRASAIAFHNEGRASYGAIIRSQYTIMNLYSESGSLIESFRLDWLYFTNRTDIDVEKAAVSPVLIPGGKVVSHEIEFYPRVDSIAATGDQKPNHYRWFDMIDLMLKKGNSRLKKIVIDFYAEVVGDVIDFPVSCVFWVDDIALDSLRDNKEGIGLFPRKCYAL